MATLQIKSLLACVQMYGALDISFLYIKHRSNNCEKHYEYENFINNLFSS